LARIDVEDLSASRQRILRQLEELEIKANQSNIRGLYQDVVNSVAVRE